MSIMSDPNLWVICALVFLLGLLIGVFLTAGGRRKWKTRYQTEADRREAIEREHAEREKSWAQQEKHWRERDSLRTAAIKDPREPGDQEVRSL
jgi:predicted histidine transporter YuiF (NhaC family)